MKWDEVQLLVEMAGYELDIRGLGVVTLRKDVGNEVLLWQRFSTSSVHEPDVALALLQEVNDGAAPTARMAIGWRSYWWRS